MSPLVFTGNFRPVSNQSSTASIPAIFNGNSQLVTTFFAKHGVGTPILDSFGGFYFFVADTLAQLLPAVFNTLFSVSTLPKRRSARVSTEGNFSSFAASG